MKKLIIPIAVMAISLTMISAGFAGLFGGKSVEGEIQEISANTLTIKEVKADQADQANQAADQAAGQADQAAEQAAPISIEVNQDTKFEKVDSLAGLAQGDRVKIDYEEDQNRNLATKVEKQGAPEGNAADADMQQQPTPAESNPPAQY